MKSALPVALCFKPLVMPARVGMSVVAVRCLAEAWVWTDVLALRGSGHIREGKAMRHNASGACVI